MLEHSLSVSCSELHLMQNGTFLFLILEEGKWDIRKGRSYAGNANIGNLVF